MADWKDVYEIELDKSPVFHYEINIYSRTKLLLDRLIIKPPDDKKALEILIKLEKKWNEWRKENEAIFTSGESSK